MIEAQVIWEIRSELGEGPIWWKGTLYWVDINAPRLHVYTPATEEKRSFSLREMTGTVVPRAGGGLILAQESGLCAFDPETEVAERLPWPEDQRIVNRFNDGKCDPQGRFWAGKIDKPVVIGEFHFGALDRGKFHASLRPVADQQARGAAYEKYVTSALENPLVVGTHWHQYGDQATTGRDDGENFQNGFIDICDTPYTETIAACRRIGSHLYEVRAGKDCPSARRDQ